MNSLKYTCLLGGGAIRGVSYIGAMRAMEELNVEYDILAGSSVGSIFATFMACGYKSYELENIFLKVNFDLFKDIHLGFNKNLALSKGEIFVDWLNEVIANKTGKKNITFAELEQPLVIITTDITNFKTQEFSKEKTPDFEVAKAIKISSSMPGLMAPYKFEDKFLVDGDLQKASPMWRLSDTLNNSESRILEFRLEGDCGSKVSNNPVSYINTIYSCVTDVATDFVTELYGSNDRFDCLKLNTGSIFFADFNLNKDERRKLIENGYKQTIEYFTKKLPEKKTKIVEVYSAILKYLKSMYKGLKANDVEEVQWWMGDLFILLCENKEIVDPVLYENIVSIKSELSESVKTILFFQTKFSNKQDLEDKMRTLIKVFDAKVTELKIYLQGNS